MIEKYQWKRQIQKGVTHSGYTYAQKRLKYMHLLTKLFCIICKETFWKKKI